MRLRGRGAAARRRMLCLWLLLLGFALLALVFSDLLNWEHSRQEPGPPGRPLHRLPSAPELEVIVDSRDPALELGLDMAPLQSLQEDQLLFVPSTQGTKSPAQKKSSYKVLLPATNKEQSSRSTAPPARTEAAHTEKDAQLSALHKYGFNEVASEKIPLHRSLPETRHPE